MAEETVSKKRKTMKYLQFEMLNETDLHRKVIDFIRKYYPQAIIIPGLGELQHIVNESGCLAKKLQRWTA